MHAPHANASIAEPKIVSGVIKLHQPWRFENV
jgi:hypothetical protein